MLYSWHPYQVRDMLYLLDVGSSPVRRELVFVGRTSIGRINPLSSRVDGYRNEGRPAYRSYVPLSVLKYRLAVNGRVLWIGRFVTGANEVIIA